MIDHTKPEPAEPILQTAKQVAAQLQISMRTLWRMKSGRKLPAPIQVGSSVRWRKEDIANWISAGCPKLESGDNASRRK